jgi:nucleotide-binding universal stress UspA family protein
MGVRIVWMHDLSEHATHAEGAVGALGRLLEADVILAHATGPGGAVRAVRPKEVLAPIAQRLRDDDVPCEICLEATQPEEAAVALARREAPDLMVISSTRVQGLDRFLVGSTARRILRAVPGSVLVANDTAFHSLSSVLVAIDVDHPDGAAIRWAARLARHGARVTALTVLPPGASVAELAEVTGRMRTYVEHVLGTHFPANWMVRPVSAKTAQAGILSAAEGHDLVVLTTHGRTGLSRFLEGSVAEKLVSACPASVLVAR